MCSGLLQKTKGSMTSLRDVKQHTFHETLPCAFKGAILLDYFCFICDGNDCHAYEETILLVHFE